MRVETNTEGDAGAVVVEQQLLGAVLTDNERFHAVSSMLMPEHFSDPVHADIWRNISGRIANSHLASAATLSAELENHAGLKELGGPRYLVNLIATSVSGFAVKDYAREVVELARRRELRGRLQEALLDLDSGKGASDVTSSLELMLHELEPDREDPRTMSMLKAQTLALEQMHEIQQGNSLGVPTGLKTLDEVLTLAPKRYSILGGATSMGKTAFSVWLAYAAAQENFGVGFLTLEMPEEDLAKRTNSIVSEVPYKAYDRPMSETLFQKTLDAAKDLQSLPVEIFSERVRDVPAVLSEGRRLHNKWKPTGNFKGFKLLVIDYIQLMRGRGESQFVQLSRIANDLKQVAKQLDVHVLALAQIDRKIVEREDKRPRLSDLRGSGDLENAPDNVMFCYRPEYYLKRQQPPKDIEKRADWEAECADWAGKAEIIIEKARMGEITSVTVGCDMGTNRFWDLEPKEEYEF